MPDSLPDMIGYSHVTKYLQNPAISRADKIRLLLGKKIQEMGDVDDTRCRESCSPVFIANWLELAMSERYEGSITDFFEDPEVPFEEKTDVLQLDHVYQRGR